MDNHVKSNCFKHVNSEKVQSEFQIRVRNIRGVSEELLKQHFTAHFGEGVF